MPIGLSCAATTMPRSGARLASPTPAVPAPVCGRARDATGWRAVAVAASMPQIQLQGSACRRGGLRSRVAYRVRGDGPCIDADHIGHVLKLTSSSDPTAQSSRASARRVRTLCMASRTATEPGSWPLRGPRGTAPPQRVGDRSTWFVLAPRCSMRSCMTFRPNRIIRVRNIH
jgi:hypothetical protein